MNTDEGSEARAVAVRVYKWILSSYRPLRVSDLSYAAAIRDDGALDAEVDDDFVLDVCSNFVTIDTSEQAQFVHASVREFLEDLESDSLKVYSERSVHTQAAKACLIYLTSSLFLSAPELDLYTGFPEYVRHFWAHHCNSCENNRKKDNVLQRSFLDFMSLKEVHPGFRRWHGCLKSIRALLFEHFSKPESMRSHYGSDIDKFGTLEQDCLSREPNPFLVACAFGFPDVVKKHLTQDQAMLSAQNSRSRSGLFLACNYGHVDMALMLLEKGASVDTPDNLDRTPLDLAVSAENEALVRMLLEAGADVNRENRYGWRPLGVAVYRGSIPLVQVLLDFKADPNILATEEETCLGLAIKERRRSIAQLLCEAGARISLDVPQGLTSSLTRCTSAPDLLSVARQDGRTEHDHEHQYKGSWKTQRRMDPRRVSDDIVIDYHTPNTTHE